jgi:AraC-like DNA-binding protein
MPIKAHSSPRDLLAELLRSIRLRKSIYFRPEFRAPWGIRIDRPMTTFHIVTHGMCWLELDGATDPLRLSAGDLVVLPRGHAHVIRDAPTTPAVDFFELIKRSTPDATRKIRAGGNGRVTRFLCGAMQFQSGVTDSLLAILPSLIVVKGQKGRSPRWLQATIMQIVDELGSDRGCTEAVVTRLGDVIFIHAASAHLDKSLDGAKLGWLAGLRDEQVGRALALLHARPHEPWTLETLADHLGIGRTTLAEKFSRLVGEPPIRYLTRLRLDAASVLLRSSDDKLGAIAAAVGYSSVAAFAKAFKRQVGTTPGDYRRAR